MQTCPKMKAIITELAAKHGLSLTEPGAWLRLEMPHFDRLVIEGLGQNRVSVAHYYEQNGDLVPDPDVTFIVTPGGAWLAAEFQNALFHGLYAVQGADGSIAVKTAAQADCADFCETWAENIRGQGWLEHGQRTDDVREAA